MVFIISIIIIFTIITFIISFKINGPPKWKSEQDPSKARKIEQRIKFGNYQVDLVKHPENVYAMHLCLDSNRSEPQKSWRLESISYVIYTISLFLLSIILQLFSTKNYERIFT